MAGISGTDSGSEDTLNLMLGRLHHRGPESKWIHCGERVALGCCVLPSDAHEPTSWLAFITNLVLHLSSGWMVISPFV